MVACALLSSEIVGGRQDPPPRFKTAIHVVEVDATVFDAAGRPVRGLTASDFSLRENGEPRRIVAVTEVSLPVGSSDAGALSPRHDVAHNQAPEGRLLVLFIDDATIPPDPAMVQAAKDIAWGAVERMGPADVMSVVFSGHTNHAQDFTRDRSRLRRAIDRTTVGFDISEHTKGTLRLWGASFRTLLNIAESLRDVPRHRKAILYVSIGIPGGAVDLVREWRSVTQSSPGSNTPIYAFDPSGVGGLSGLVLGTSAAPKQAVVQGMRSTLPMAVSTMREFSRSDTVTGFLRVYQGGSADVRPVQVSVRVLDQQGTFVEPAERALLPEHFSRSRSADVSFPVPVDRLASGSYTLRVEVSAPERPVSTRELAFVVR